MCEADNRVLDSEDDSSDDEAIYPNTLKTTKKLRATLCKQVIEGMFDKVPQEFIPEGTVQQIIKREVVSKALNINTPNEEQSDLIDFIVNHARKAFAVVVMAKINANKVMRWFKERNIVDLDLPIPTKDKEWERSWRPEFYSTQWMFFATVFSTTNYDHKLQEAHIIPFVEKICEAGQGSFGIVYQYAVHKAHMQPEHKEHLKVAIKEVKPEINTQEVAFHWEKEVAALRKMNMLDHEHIIRFYTAFRRHTRNGGAEHYLMFEWADGGNLLDLWKRIPFPILTGPLAKEVIQQIFGLATALDAAHNWNSTGASFRHGDLKPENILVFANGGVIGTLKIGDWGEAKYQGQRTEMRPSGSKSRSGTIRYEAPEVKIGIPGSFEGQPKERRSRLYDIWALGCITLEFIVWLLCGLDGLNQFNAELTGPSFYQVSVENGKKVAHVHPAAIRWMERMAQHPACNSNGTAIGRLLELVRTSLLVVKLPHRLGTNLSVSEPVHINRLRRSDIVTGYGLDQSGSDQGLAVGTTPSPNSSLEANTPMIHITSHITTDKASSDTLTVNNNSDITTVKVVSDVPTVEITSADVEPETVELPIRRPIQRRPERRGDARGLSREICQKLEDILTEDDAVGYWNTHQVQQSFSALIVATPAITPVSATSSNDADVHLISAQDGSRIQKVDYNRPKLDPNDWKLHWDNDVSSKLLQSLAAAHPSEFPTNRLPSDLCDICGKYSRDLLSPGFSEPYVVSTLKERAETAKCDLCRLLWETCVRNGAKTLDYVQFDRLGPLLNMDNNSKTVLSVVRQPGTDALAGIESQVGFAQLPESGGPTHLGIVQHWLNHCDKKHQRCKLSRHLKDGARRLPTRLIDVGDPGADTVKLWETSADDRGEWIAMSHQWGDIKHHFSTTRTNLPEYLAGIGVKHLPATFKDAIIVTRALGHKYLWIDSLCIVQGHDGDFITESKRMEDVYSGAYCVIAASCAAHHQDGFLKPRIPRDYVGIIPEGRSKTPIYICQNIDNFKQHVSEGSLNRRGWVLQEHALARRTVFFTEHQTYFECSHGIRCETSTKMNNDVVALLGDSNFPNTLLSTSQGGKILQYQRLYKDYSRLGLSVPWDRPIAIEGLQQRLLDTMGVKGGFGILDEGETRGLLRRSLLWCRDGDTPKLFRIRFPKGRSSVPSWSWMAYTGGVSYPGGIDYLDLDFDSWGWEDLHSPWSQADDNTNENKSSAPLSAAKRTLIATARDLDLGAAYNDDGDLTLDDPDTPVLDTTVCVVLGKAKGITSAKEQRNCVLIIVPSGRKDEDGIEIYERVGTGFLPGKCISPSGFIVRIH